MKVELIDATVDPLFNISYAARNCFNSYDKEDLTKREAFVKSLVVQDHTPIEFAYTFWKISGISRACANQLNRYRLTSQCQQSQRYVENTEFIIPESITKADIPADALFSVYKTIYDNLIKNGIPKEDARYFLPMATQTELCIMCNLRELRHILKQRLDKHAQWEVRNVAKEIYKIAKEKWPWLVEDIKVEE